MRILVMLPQKESFTKLERMQETLESVSNNQRSHRSNEQCMLASYVGSMLAMWEACWLCGKHAGYVGSMLAMWEACWLCGKHAGYVGSWDTSAI